MGEIVTFSAKTEIDNNKLYGIAHSFGTRAVVSAPGVGTHVETFAVGAFDETLSNDKHDVIALVEHDRSKVLGRQSAGTLLIRASNEGLEYELELPNTSYAADLKELVSRGDVKEMSFGFQAGKYDWSTKDVQTRTRTHRQVRRLYEISFVAIPAFEEGTSVNLRSKSYEDESLRSQLIRIKAKIL